MLFSCCSHGILMLFSCCSHVVIMLFSWCSHVILMLFSCYFMLFSCCSHGIIMLFSCCSHVILMLFSCYLSCCSHVVLMLLSFYSHVILMLFSCCSHVVLMLFSCYSHVILMLLSCCSHVVLVLFSCCSHVVDMLFSSCYHVILMLFSCHSHNCLMLFSCCSHVIFMLFSCYSHVVLMLFSCCSHVVLMLCSCCSHVILMLFSCCSHVVLMLFSCYFMLFSCCSHVIIMLFSCCSYVILMLFSCCSHVILMLFSCCSHVVLMLFSCCSHVVLMLSSCCSMSICNCVSGNKSSSGAYVPGILRLFEVPLSWLKDKTVRFALVSNCNVQVYPSLPKSIQVQVSQDEPRWAKSPFVPGELCAIFTGPECFSVGLTPVHGRKKVRRAAQLCLFCFNEVWQPSVSALLGVLSLCRYLKIVGSLCRFICRLCVDCCQIVKLLSIVKWIVLRTLVTVTQAAGPEGPLEAASLLSNWFSKLAGLRSGHKGLEILEAWWRDAKLLKVPKRSKSSLVCQHLWTVYSCLSCFFCVHDIAVCHGSLCTFRWCGATQAFGAIISFLRHPSMYTSQP